MEQRRRVPRPRVVVASLVLVAACSDSDPVGGPPPGQGDVLVTDAPATDLASFRVGITSVRLTKGAGNPATKNLIDGPVSVELVGLDGPGAWLRTGSIPRGNYTGVQVLFDPAGFSAVGKDGSAVPVTPIATTWTVDFASVLRITGSTDYDRIVVDVDLLESLTGDLTGVDFTPDGSVATSDGSTPQEIDEVRGVVDEFSAALDEIELETFVDDDLDVDLGDVVVRTDGSTVTLAENGSPLALGAFYGSLSTGDTLLEVHGDLGEDGVLLARLITIEDQNEGFNVANDVKLEGTVVGLVGTTFDLRIGEVEKGAAVAGPVLAGLADPTTPVIDVVVGTTVLDEVGQALAPADLTVGTRVEVLLQTFHTDPEPFPAFRVRRLAVAGAETAITDVAGLPDDVVVNLDANDPLIASGDVADDTTDVTLDLTGATFVLGTDGRPALAAADLLTGLEARAEGDFSADTIDVDRLFVRPGRMTGEVATMADATTFTTSLDTLLDPFGDTVVSDPFTVRIDPACVFQGDATSGQDLKDLFDLHGAGAVDLEIEGIGTGVADEILAFEIEVTAP